MEQSYSNPEGQTFHVSDSSNAAEKLKEQQQRDFELAKNLNAAAANQPDQIKPDFRPAQKPAEVVEMPKPRAKPETRAA